MTLERGTDCMIYKLFFQIKNLTDVLLFLGVFLNTSTEWFMAPVDWTELDSSCER